MKEDRWARGAATTHLFFIFGRRLMSCQRTRKVAFRKSVLVPAAVFLAAALFWYLAVWIPGLPGPLHDAYVSCGLLGNIYRGLAHYDEAHCHLPQATAKDAESGSLSSWRLEVCRSFARLGFASGYPASPLEYDYHRPWNDPRNARIEPVGAYFVPTGLHLEPSERGIYMTYYKAITGPETAFDPDTPRSLKELPHDLIIVVQVPRSDTHWMEPGDLRIGQLTPSEETKRQLLCHDGYVVLFADGQCWVLSRKTPISDVCKFFTIPGARQADREQVLGPYAVLR